MPHPAENDTRRGSGTQEICFCIPRALLGTMGREFAHRFSQCSPNQRAPGRAVEKTMAEDSYEAPGDAIVGPIILLTPIGQKYLDQTRPWARFLSIFCFAGACLSALAGLALIAIGLLGHIPESQGLHPMFGRAFGVVSGLLYILVGALYVPAGIFLFRYGGALRSLADHGTTEILENALKQQRSFWRYAGILALIGVLVVVFAFFAALFLALFARYSQ